MTATEAATSVVYNIPEVNSGTTTSWIPLTTPWPSLSGCASSFFLFPGQPAPVGWDPGYGYFFGGTPRCLPPAVTTWWEQNHQNGDGFTSLSLRPIVCPAAYTTAATSLQSGSSTLVLCCPSGYDLQDGEPGRAVGTCASPLIPGQTITYLASFATGVNSTTLAIQSSTSITAGQIYGWNVAAPTTSGASSSTTSHPSSIISTSSSCNGLSPGAKGGIGISAAVGAIGIIALMWAFFLLRQRPKVTQYNTAAPVPAESKYVHEMNAEQKRAELPSSR